jgi:non-ribosomal peptide synthetase component E (peptide arylation enzyme)
MISLPSIENVLQEKYGKEDELNLAIEWIEISDGRAKIVLFVTPDTILSIQKVNQYLRDRWISNLISINQIITIEAIPVLWTWKIDYKVLKKLIWNG